MFSGLKVLFSGGITSGQLKVFSKRFIEKKGIVAIREKMHPMFNSKVLKPLESDINYIIVENRTTTNESLCQQLRCPDIPDQVTVVHREWLELSLSTNSTIDIADYVVDISAVAPVASIEETSEGVNNALDPANLKRKRSVSECDGNESPRMRECEVSNCQKEALEFTLLQPEGNPAEEFNTLFTASEKPSLLYKFSLSKKPSFCQLIAFDMDGTLITTKSGATFSKAVDDWKFLYPNVPAMLREKYKNGAHLAIISNQNGIAKGHTTIPELVKKLTAVSDAIGVPIDILCAFENDLYRKPRVGSFDFLLSQRVGGAVLSTSGLGGNETGGGTTATELRQSKVASRDASILSHCLYVGDAAGRAKQGTRKKDFSSSDYKLALNAKIGFETPEQFFLGSKQPLHCDRSLSVLGPSWTDLINTNRLADVTITSSPTTDSESASDGNIFEIVLLVGPPASGKSTIARSLERTHVRVNQDLLKTKKACFKAAMEHFASMPLEQVKDDDLLSSQVPRGVVIDATNSNRTTRKEWVEFAKARGVPIRCIHIKVTKDLCFHLAAYRLVSPLSLPEDRRNIEQVVIHTYFKHMEPPSLEEGFTSVTTRQFTPRMPADIEAARLLSSYLR